MILLPHGGYPLIACTLSTMAWMTTVSHDGCDFSRLTGPAVSVLTSEDANYPFIELGFTSYRVPVFYEEYNEWQIRYSDECRLYDRKYNANAEESAVGNDWSFDFFWKVGSITHQIGLVLGGASCLFLWVSSTCAPITMLTWRLIGVQLSLAAFFHLSSFLWFFNGLCYIEESRCHSFYGSNSLAAALVLYFLSILSIFLKYPEPTVVKVVRTRVEAGFQRYEYTEATYPPSEIDEASGIHSLASSNSFGRGHTATGAVARTGVSTSGNNWQRSQRDIIV